MPSNGYSVGRDGLLSVVLNGVVQQWSVRTRFRYRYNADVVKSYQVDTGLTVPIAVAPQWSGEIHYDRQNSQFERYFTTFMANWIAGLNNLSLTLKFRVTEPSGTVTRYTFEQCAFKEGNFGEWELQNIPRMDTAFDCANVIIV